MKKILVTGGAGFIGSQVSLVLAEAGYTPHVLDNLLRGSEKAVLNAPLHRIDLSEKEKIAELLKKEAFEAVFHFAALADVGESVKNPLLYYQNNVEGTFNLLEAMEQCGPKLLIFSSTAAVYGTPETIPITEEAKTLPINPYGESKLAVEKRLAKLQKNSDFRSISFRYFNAAGGDPRGILKNYKKKENNLIPLLIKAKREAKSLTVFGTDWPTRDGTCIRDYIHIEDLANAHLLGLQWLMDGGSSEIFNLGNGEGFTVLEVIRAFEEITREKAPIIFGNRRLGDPAILVASSKKAEELLGFSPKHSSLEQILSDAINALP